VLKQSSAEGVVVSRMDSALFCYTFERWRKIEERIVSLAAKGESMRRLRRIFIGGAFECLLDKQGRVLIPPSLRHYAGLNKEVVLVGVLEYFEIWARENWVKEDKKFQSDVKSEDMIDAVAELGL
jgi:MraZ protein